MLKTIFVPVVFLCAFLALGAACRAANKAPSPAISGLWYTQDRDGGIELYPCGNHICGRFYWLQSDSPGNISRDTKNPDPAKRNRPLCRMQFMGGFTADPDMDGRYVDGWIYSPKHGKRFDAEMTLTGPDTLELHGYVLLPIFGEGQTWTRAAQLPKCVKK